MRNLITVAALVAGLLGLETTAAVAQRSLWPGWRLSPTPPVATQPQVAGYNASGFAAPPPAQQARRGASQGNRPQNASQPRRAPQQIAPRRGTPAATNRVVQAARWQDPPAEMAPPLFEESPVPGDPTVTPPMEGFPPETAPPSDAPVPPGLPGPTAPLDNPPFAEPPTGEGSAPSPTLGQPPYFEEPEADPEPTTEIAPTPQPAGPDPFDTHSPFDYAPYDAPPDEYEVCPHCHGYFCNHCGAKWFFRAELQLLHRAHSETNAGLTRGTLIANTTFGLPTVSVFSETLLDTEAADYLLEPGARLTLGRFLGFDDRGRMHSLEGAYWGGQDWQIEGQLTGRRITYIAPDINGNGSIVPDDFITSGNLLSFFNLEMGGFNRAEQHIFTYRSEVHNASYDYRIRWNVGRDRLVAKHDGRWVKEHNTGWIHSVHGGFRYIHLDEDFTFQSRGNVSVNGGPELPIRGEWDTKTDNDLFGLQVGGDLTRQWEKWSLGARGLFGILVNFSSMDGRIMTSDPVFPLNGDPNLTNINNAWSFHEQNLAIVGETGFQAVYRLRPHWNLRASYDFYWVQGVALAAEQFADHQPIGPNAIDSDGFLFLHGPSLGLDLVW